MKKSGKIYKWIIISMIFQVAVLAYFNNVYLVSRGEATAKLVDGTEEKPKKNMKVDIPQGAKDIKVSFDNTLAAYMLNDKLEIINVGDGKTVKTISSESDEITYYRWLPDRNMVIYAVKAPDNQSGKVQVLTYNVDSEVEHAYPKITSVPSKSKITAIELSPLTNVVYARVATGNGNAKIYKYDIMSQLSFVMNASDKTVMRELNYDNKMIYQDEKNKLFEYDGLKASSKLLAFNGKLVLFAVVGLDDEIYAGELNSDGKVVKIRYGASDTAINKWNIIELKTPVLPENVIVNSDGNVFERIEEKSLVYNLKNDKKIEYDGTFVELFGKHIMTMEGKTLKIEGLD